MIDKPQIKTELIAEIGQAHDGSLGIAHSYIDALSAIGIETIKFQYHIAEAESSTNEEFRINFSYQDKTRFDYWKRISFSFEDWVSLKKHCDEVGVEFMCSPFSCKAVDKLEKLEIKRYKIGSGELTNNLILDKIGMTKKPIILSTGMADEKEIRQAFENVNKDIDDITIMQCTSRYPTNMNEIGIEYMDKLRRQYKTKTGLSDHSGTIFPSLAAATLGADIVEVHATFDKNMFGPDAESSLTIKELQHLACGIKSINEMMNSSYEKNNVYREKSKMKRLFEKSLAVNTDLKKGSIIQFEHLESKKPSGLGLTAKNYKDLVGKKLIRDMAKYEFINMKDIEVEK